MIPFGNAVTRSKPDRSRVTVSVLVPSSPIVAGPIQRWSSLTYVDPARTLMSDMGGLPSQMGWGVLRAPKAAHPSPGVSLLGLRGLQVAFASLNAGRDGRRRGALTAPLAQIRGRRLRRRGRLGRFRRGDKGEQLFGVRLELLAGVALQAAHELGGQPFRGADLVAQQQRLGGRGSPFVFGCPLGEPFCLRLVLVLVSLELAAKRLRLAIRFGQGLPDFLGNLDAWPLRLRCRRGGGCPLLRFGGRVVVFGHHGLLLVRPLTGPFCSLAEPFRPLTGPFNLRGPLTGRPGRTRRFRAGYWAATGS